MHYASLQLSTSNEDKQDAPHSGHVYSVVVIFTIPEEVRKDGVKFPNRVYTYANTSSYVEKITYISL